MDFFNLEGKVALVTGGNGGLGLAFGKGLVKAGAKVAIWGRNESKNKHAVAELKKLGGDAAAFICDVTDESNVDTAFTATMERFGQVDICFANAGASGPTIPFAQLRIDKWKSHLDINLNSVVYTYQKVISQLLERNAPGKLIVTSSIAGVTGAAFAAGYSTTKAAVLGLTRALAIELGRNKIQANAILPGYIITEMSENAPDVFKDAMLRRAASGRYGTLEEMEGVAVFLASKASDYMTGQCVVMDGGHTIHPM